MLTHSPRDRSRSPHSTNGTSIIQTNSSSVEQLPSTIHTSNRDGTSSEIESTINGSNHSKAKKESESKQHMRSLKSFIQTLINESASSDSTYDEQVKVLESACIEEYHDLSLDRIRRMIRSVLKLRKSHSTTPFLHQDHTNTNDRFNSIEKKSRSNLTSNNTTAKTSDLVASPVSTFDTDFLRHAFSQPFRPPIDLSAYFPASTVSNGASSIFSPNFSPSSFLQSLTNTTPLAPPLPPPPLSHTHTNGTNDTSNSSIIKSTKQVKLSNNETSSIKVLVNAYREAASYLCRSADELEQLM